MESRSFESPISYFDKRFGIEAIKLLPGQYFVTTQDKVLVTVLGSCVAACLFDPKTGIGGMNHFMLPSVNKTILQLEQDDCLVTKYGIHAMEILINELVKAGAEKARLKAKVFGGGNALGVLLTGMGKDGANGLLEMFNAGSETFCQDEASCIVFGMPKVAIEKGAAKKVVSLDEMGRTIMQAVEKMAAGSRL